MNDATGRQREVWQKAAPTYDRKIAGVERGLVAGGREWIGERATGRVLEVAIGTGRSLEHYGPDVIRRPRPDPRDAEARKAACRAFRCRGRTHRGGCGAAAVHAASFDTVVCELGLCSIPHPAIAITEMARVLKPRGTLLLLDHIGSNWPPIWMLQWLVERVTIGPRASTSRGGNSVWSRPPASRSSRACA